MKHLHQRDNQIPRVTRYHAQIKSSWNSKVPDQTSIELMNTNL